MKFCLLLIGLLFTGCSSKPKELKYSEMTIERNKLVIFPSGVKLQEYISIHDKTGEVCRYILAPDEKELFLISFNENFERRSK